MKSASLILGSGYTLYYFSERMFWSFVRPDDTWLSLLGGILLYVFLAHVILVVINYFHVSCLWAYFLVGAFYGWLDEGVFAMTLFGDGGMPLPFSVAWTALAWHMPSLVLGLFCLRQALQAQKIWPSLYASLSIGLFWGLWATVWRGETPPLSVSTTAFFLHCAIVTLGLALSQWAIDYGNIRQFKTSRASIYIAFGIISAFCIFVTIPAVPWSPLILVPLFSVVFYVLNKNRLAFAAETLEPSRTLNFKNLTALFVIPVVAACIYLTLSQPIFPALSAFVISAGLMVIGTTSFGVAIFQIAKVRRRNLEL